MPKAYQLTYLQGFLVIFASRLGMPVSTTHVSVGSIFYGGIISQQAQTHVLYQILIILVFAITNCGCH